MGITESLGNVYVKVEDAYYGVLDFFEEKGIGLPWSYNDFLEQKGIPALPFTAALLVILIGSMAFVSMANAPQDASFTLSLKDNKGQPLEDVSIQIFDSKGNLLDELTASDGQSITLSSLPPQEELTIQATKQGFGSQEGTLFVGEENLRLSFQGSNDAIVGKLKLVDAETQTIISDAVVSVTWTGSESPVIASANEEGIILLSVPLHQELSLVARADNYEDLIDFILFTGDEIKLKEMTPKASASEGPSVLFIKAIDKTTQLPLENVHIKIENAQSGETITDVDASSGTHTENLTKGLVVRVSVSKEGYTSYTSNTEFPGGKTLRNNEETILTPLSFGGTSLFVITQNEQSKQPLQGVELSLLDELFDKMDSQTSNFSGESEFAGLNETNEYHLLAYSPNFYPKRMSVEWVQLAAGELGKTMNVGLVPFTSGNSGTLAVFVSEKDGKAATQATLQVYDLVGEEFVPLIAPRGVDSVGSFTVRLPVGTKLLVHAEKENVSAEEEITIVSGLNKVVLTLDADFDEVEFTLLSTQGQPFTGNITIHTANGTSLFSGNTTNGKITARIPKGETVTITATDNTGKIYKKTINVGTNKEHTITLDTDALPSNTPEITYEGLFSANGNPIPGISPQEDGFARFTVKWPANMQKGGVFVRVGTDNVTSIDSQFVGIFGLNGDADTINYGRTWNPLPKPGKETKDRATLGKAGSFSKWVEIVVNNPTGTQTFDVRLKAREGTPAGTIELNYRAFTQNGNTLIRTPTDSELGSASYVSTKSGLYAQSKNSSITLYEALPFCQGSICTTIHFVDEDNRLYPIGNMQALLGKKYALQVNVQTAKPLVAGQAAAGEGLVPLTTVTGGTSSSSSAIVKATTSNENPLLVFTKTETGTFGKLEDNGNKDTSISVTLSGTSTATGTDARIHFLPEEEGQTTIQLQIISNNEAWNQTLSLEIVQPKHLNVVVADFVETGEKIELFITDDEGNTVGNALISLTDAEGKLAASMKGTNTLNKGENGKYILDKSLDAGLYQLKVKLPGYADAEEGIAIGIKEPLKVDKVELSIPFGQTKVTQNVSVTNTTKHSLTNVTGELITFEGFPNEFTLEIGTIPIIAPNGKATLPITATYSGETESTATLTGSAQLKLSGNAALSFPIHGQTSVAVVYNKKLDSSCLQFNKDKLSVVVMGENQPYGNLYGGTTSTLNSNVPYYGFSQGAASDVYNSQGYNGIGYNSSGTYQYPETKRVSVKATNNCGSELTLIPGITSQDGQPVVDGFRIAAIDSSFKLAQGQEKQVDFEVSNQLFHAGFSPTGINYFATFSSAQLVATLPFEVTFWDRSRAIQTPSSIELTLIKANAKSATDKALIPITNIGAGPIYSLTATLEGEAVNDVSLKLENPPNKNTGNQSILLPGQTLYPPLSIVGESLRDESSVVTKRIIISGIVEGRRMNLKEIEVFARTGSSSCLEISAFDTPISFISSETIGSLSKNVTLSNKCLEPVRVTGVEPESIGANTFDLSPTNGNDIIEKDEEVEYNLILTKANAHKAQLSISVKGIMVLSQKTIQSNTLPVHVALGEQELEFSQASNPVQVPVCEGGTLNVRYPVQAKKNECGQAYCDAEQAAHYLSEIIEKQMVKVLQQTQSKKNDATQFTSCDISNRYCTFSQLGVSSPSVDLYLQHDSLTPNLMEYVMKSGPYPRLGSLATSLEPQLKGESADNVFASRLGTGFGNAVFLPEIRGCGVYRVAIIGGVEVVTNQLQADKITIGIKLVQDREKTAECQDKIYNAANFLPKDRSLSVGNSHQTLFGVVEYDAGLEDPAQVLAETVFGSKERATQNSGTNRMHLKIGNLSQSIVELTLDPATKGDGTKNIVTVVRQTQGRVQNEAMIEAGKIITSLGKNVNGCITEDEQTWRIYSIANVGQYTYEGCPLDNSPEGGLVVRSIQTCCMLTTKSDIQSEATYTLDPNGANALDGLNQLDLYEVNPTSAKAGAKITYNAEYPLTFNTKTQVYEKEVLLCGTADPRTQQLVHKQTVQTSTTRTLDDTKAGPLKLELRTCTFDADDAIAKAYNKGNGTWYATVDWDEDVDRKTLVQTIEEAVNGNKLGESYVSYQEQNIFASDNPVYQEKFGEKKDKAMFEFGATCAAACGICSLAAGAVTAGAGWAAGATECLLSCGVGTGVGLYENHKEGFDGVPVVEGVRDIVIEPTYGTYRDALSTVVPGSGENPEAASALIAGSTASVVKGVKVYRSTKPNDVPALPTALDVSFAAQELTSVEAAKQALQTYNARVEGILNMGLSPSDLKLVQNEVSQRFVGGGVALSDVHTTITRIDVVGSDYKIRYKVKIGNHAVANQGTLTETGQFFSTIKSKTPNVDLMKPFTQAELDALAVEMQKAKRGAEALATKYKALSSTEFAPVIKNIETTIINLDNAEQNLISHISTSINPKAIAPLNLTAFDSATAELNKAVKAADTIAKKTNPTLFQKGKNLTAKKAPQLKGLARNLVCGGLGNVAGYAMYRDEFKTEVENKIVLDAGSSNVLDAQTEELIFEKGQTYQFSVSTIQGTGKSHKIVLDIVSPSATVTPASWLDDCGKT